MDLELTEHRLGKGRYGQVLLALWLGQPCAVKLKHVTKTDAEQKKLRQEISILSKLKHPHIVHFLGDVKLDGMLVIVMEYAENGSLASLILDRNRSLAGWPEKERIAQEIVRGVAYLHSLNIVHCDLKSSNMLLDHSMRAKICDFGMSIIRNSVASLPSDSHSRRGTVRWLAPELLAATEPEYTTRSDIYALGCIMWEMAADSTPPFKDLDQIVVAERVYSGEREEIPNDTPEEYRRWIERCWSHDPASRPEATGITRQFSISESLLAADICDLGARSSSTVASQDSESACGISSGKDGKVQPPAYGQDESHQVSIETGNFIRALEFILPHLKFYRKTMHQLFDDSKEISTSDDVNDDELVKILQKIYLLALQLSMSGAALLISIDTLSKDLINIREMLKSPLLTPVTLASSSNNRNERINIIQETLETLSLAPAAEAPSSSSNDNGNDSNDSTTAATVEKIEQEEKAQLAVVQAKLKKHRFSAEKLFGDYNIRPDDLRRFVLPKESLQYDASKPIYEDDISETYEGEFAQGLHQGEKVHIKCLEETDGGSTKDIIQRTIFLTHLLRSCENIARPRFVVQPNLILSEPSTQIRLSDYPLAYAQKLGVALKIAGALALVHSFKIVHRDVRASNVIMLRRGDGDSTVVIPQLTGFEVCRHIQYDYSLGSVVKRGVWHAPERVSWHGTSFKTDVFSFGVLMYEISMGHPPEMKGSDVKHADVQDWIQQEYDHVSQGYSNLMRQCLTIDYPKRPLMPEVVEELIRIASWQPRLPPAPFDIDASI